MMHVADAGSLSRAAHQNHLMNLQSLNAGPQMGISNIPIHNNIGSRKNQEILLSVGKPRQNNSHLEPYGAINPPMSLKKVRG